MAFDDSNILGETIETLGDTAKQTAKQLAQTPGALAKTAGQQLQVPATNPTTATQNLEAGQQTQQRQQAAQDMVKGMYEASTTNGPVDPAAQQKIDAQQQAEVRKKLQQQHNAVYYQPLINPPKQEEIHQAEKIEMEKKQEVQELQEKEAKKPPPLAVQRGAQRTEKFPGASG